MLNLACTDSIKGAFCPGTIITIPGRSDSGKTILALTSLGSSIEDTNFKKYKFIYDDSESKMKINLEHLFNTEIKNRIELPPFGPSSSIQNFEANIVKSIREGDQPCIYVLDTPDSLTTNEELEKVHQKLIKMAKSSEDLKSISGSYHMEKAKMLHRVLREINDSIEKTKSLLILVQQSRDRIKVGFGRQENTAGGRAPAHYSTHRIWLIPIGKIRKLKEVIGITTEAQIEKNHYNGKLRNVKFNIYYDYGIDDISSIVDWIVDNGYWKIRKKTIIAEELELELAKEKLVKTIEKENMEGKLKLIVEEFWKEKEDSLKLNRKKRF